MKHLYPILFLVLLTSCKSSKKVATTQTTSTKTKLLQQYKQYKGIPYKYGGTTRKGFDCSGFVNQVYINVFSIDLPRTTQQMKSVGNKVKRSNLQVGDLLFFRPERKYNHVGIYVGNNEMIHSSTSKGVSKISLDNPYWKKYYLFARRVR